jgi:hypothetical protein
MPLNAAQIADCAAKAAQHLFGGVAALMGGTANATATVNWQDLQNAVSALDAAFDTQLATAVAQASGATTVVQYLAGQIPAPASGGTAQQKTVLACYVLLKRAGLI